MKLFHDVLFNPLYLEDYADLVRELIASDASGILNLGAAGSGLSKATFAYALADCFGVSARSAVTTSIDDVKLAAVRPKDMRMDVIRLCNLLPGRAIPTIESGLERMRRDAFSRSKQAVAEPSR